MELLESSDLLCRSDKSGAGVIDENVNVAFLLNNIGYTFIYAGNVLYIQLFNLQVNSSLFCSLSEIRLFIDISHGGIDLDSLCGKLERYACSKSG